MEQVFIGHARDDGVFRDFCDGTFVKNHPGIQHTDALLLSLYFDELEVANPLGSKRGKHKLGKLEVFHHIHAHIIFLTVYRSVLLDVAEYSPSLSVVTTLHTASSSCEILTFKTIWN